MLTNILDYGCDVQEAIDMPRGLHYEGQYQLEDSVPAGDRRGPEEARPQDHQRGRRRSAAPRRSGSTGRRARSPAVPIRARTAARSVTEWHARGKFPARSG